MISFLQILWLIPGILIRNALDLKQSRFNTPLAELAPISAISIIIFAISRLTVCLLAMVALNWNWQTYNNFRKLFHQFIPTEYSGTFAVAILGALFLSVLINCFSKTTCFGFIGSIFGWVYDLAGRTHADSTSDPYYSSAEELTKRGQLALLSFKNDRHIVGKLLAFTADPYQQERYLRIKPVMTGARDEESKKVVYTTFYVEYKDLILGGKKLSATLKEIPARLVPMSEIIGLSKFDLDLHDYFKKNNRTEIDEPVGSEKDITDIIDEIIKKHQ